MKRFFAVLLCLIMLLSALGLATIRASAATDSGLSSAECMVTIEASSRRVLYGHNTKKRRPMASVTKILTAITVIENCSDLESKITVPQKAQGVEGSSIYLQAGEKISVLDLLYGLMLQSGNDCATALALSIGGSIEGFAELMNITAKNAGATDSNFVNPHGLHHDNHYTTAYDLALITAYAMQNPVFKEICATKTKKIERTREGGMEIIANKNKLLSSFNGADGVKTGFTKKAGRCLVASATRDGMQVISVVLNCGPMFQDCARLMESAFNEFKLVCVAKAGDVLAQVDILNSKTPTVKAGLKTDVYYPLRSFESINVQHTAVEGLKAPLKRGHAVGDITFSLNGQAVLKSTLCTLEDATALSLSDYLKDIVKDW